GAAGGRGGRASCPRGPSARAAPRATRPPGPAGPGSAGGATRAASGGRVRSGGSGLTLGPPRPQLGLALGGVARADLHAPLEQEPVRLADLAAGTDAEHLHDPGAVDVGPDRGELLGLAQLRDALLEVVVRGAQPLRL